MARPHVHPKLPQNRRGRRHKRCTVPEAAKFADKPPSPLEGALDARHHRRWVVLHPMQCRVGKHSVKGVGELEGVAVHALHLDTCVGILLFTSAKGTQQVTTFYIEACDGRIDI